MDIKISNCFNGAGQAIIRHLHPGFLTWFAQTIDLEFVSDGFEAVFLGDLGLNVLDLPALEFHDPTAFQADEVFVNRLLGEAVFVAFEPLTEVMLHHQTTSDQKIQRAIDGGLPDSVPRPSEADFDLLDGEVLDRRKHDLRNGLPLMSHRESLLFQVASKEPLGSRSINHRLASMTLRVFSGTQGHVLGQEPPESLKVTVDLFFPGHT